MSKPTPAEMLLWLQVHYFGARNPGAIEALREKIAQRIEAAQDWNGHPTDLTIEKIAELHPMTTTDSAGDSLESLLAQVASIQVGPLGYCSTPLRDLKEAAAKQLAALRFVPPVRQDKDEATCREAFEMSMAARIDGSPRSSYYSAPDRALLYTGFQLAWPARPAASASDGLREVRDALEFIVRIGCVLDAPGEPRVFCKEDGSGHSIYCAAGHAAKALSILDRADLK